MFSNPNTKTKKAKLWGFCSFLDVDRTPLKVLSLFLYLSEDFFFVWKLIHTALFWGVMLINFVPSLWLKIDLVFFWKVKDESLGFETNGTLGLVSISYKILELALSRMTNFGAVLFRAFKEPIVHKNGHFWPKKQVCFIKQNYLESRKEYFHHDWVHLTNTIEYIQIVHKLNSSKQLILISQLSPSLLLILLGFFKTDIVRKFPHFIALMLHSTLRRNPKLF